MDELKKDSEIPLQEIWEKEAAEDFIARIESKLSQQWKEYVKDASVLTESALPVMVPVTPPKRSGRPKGSKDETKIETSKDIYANEYVIIIRVPESRFLTIPTNVLEHLRDEEDVARKLEILATIERSVR